MQLRKQAVTWTGRERKECDDAAAADGDDDDNSRTAAEALLMHNPTLLPSYLPALAWLACARRKETGTNLTAPTLAHSLNLTYCPHSPVEDFLTDTSQFHALHFTQLINNSFWIQYCGPKKKACQTGSCGDSPALTTRNYTRKSSIFLHHRLTQPWLVVPSVSNLRCTRRLLWALPRSPPPLWDPNILLGLRVNDANIKGGFATKEEPWPWNSESSKEVSRGRPKTFCKIMLVVTGPRGSVKSTVIGLSTKCCFNGFLYKKPMIVRFRSAVVSRFKCVRSTSTRWFLKRVQVTMKHDPM